MALGVEARCKQCDKKFGNFRVYERHIQGCNLPKDKECSICKKAYKSTERLSNHMDVAHKGSPKMICDKCGKIFTSKDSLRVHKANLHGEKVVTHIAHVVAQNNRNTVCSYFCNAHLCYARIVHSFHMQRTFVLHAYRTRFAYAMLCSLHFFFVTCTSSRAKQLIFSYKYHHYQQG